MRRSPGEGNGYPLQYSGLENSMDYIVHGITKSRTRLSTFTFWSSSLNWSSPALKILTGLLAGNWHKCMNVCVCVCVCACARTCMRTHTNSKSGKISHTEKLKQPLDFLNFSPIPHAPSLPSYPCSLLSFQITCSYLSSWVSLHHPIPYYLTGT